MIRRAVRTIRPGTQSRIRLSVFACRRLGVRLLVACPEAAAAGLRLQMRAERLSASRQQHSHRRLAFRLPDGNGPASGSGRRCAPGERATALRRPPTTGRAPTHAGAAAKCSND